MIRRPTRITRTPHAFPTLRSSDPRTGRQHMRLSGRGRLGLYPPQHLEFSRPRRRRDADELALLPRLAGQLRDERLLGLAIDRRRDPRRAVVVAADPGAVRDATRHLRAQPRLGVRLMATA